MHAASRCDCARHIYSQVNALDGFCRTPLFVAVTLGSSQEIHDMLARFLYRLSRLLLAMALLPWRVVLDAARPLTTC